MPIHQADESIDYKTPAPKTSLRGSIIKQIVINPCPMDTLAGNLTPPPNRGFGSNPRLTTPNLTGDSFFRTGGQSPQWTPPPGGSGVRCNQSFHSNYNRVRAKKANLPPTSLVKSRRPSKGKSPDKCDDLQSHHLRDDRCLRRLLSTRISRGSKIFVRRRGKNN